MSPVRKTKKEEATVTKPSSWKTKPKREAGQKYVLTLYVSGSTPRSAAAIANIRKICDQQLEGSYELEVIDVLKTKTLPEDNVIAVPTLVKRLPVPLRKLIGDLSDTDKVLYGLDLQKRER